ncbi:MAG TPA: PaaI family thioesterase [Gammaproteobacteria bacterium]|nr:PaaI family thioesterase [Gammaproteobacteria bacterium]
MKDSPVAIQDLYPEDFAHCYGCGRLNAHGYRIKSHEQGDVLVAHFDPEPWQLSVPGFVYGGLIASLIDCHAMAAAAAATCRAEGREPGSEPALRFVTASLKVDYLKPTPLGPLELRARAREVGARKVRLDVELLAAGEITARGDVLAVRIPISMVKP